LSHADQTSLLPDSIAGLPDGLGRALLGIANRLSGLSECEALLGTASRSTTACAWAHDVLRALEITCEVSGARLANVVPRSGPVMFVANHPFGALDALLGFAQLEPLRDDIRFLAQAIGQRIPQIAPKLLPIQPSSMRRRVPPGNVRSLLRAVRWTRAGHALALFPAPTVSHWRWQSCRTQDPPWSRIAGIVARASGATVIPLYVHGKNSALFQFVSGVCPPLRHAFLFRELLNKRGMHVRVVVGEPLSPERLSACQNADEVTAEVRRSVLMTGLQLHRRAP
jgi:putative hemolysin